MPGHLGCENYGTGGLMRQAVYSVTEAARSEGAGNVTGFGRLGGKGNT